MHWTDILHYLGWLAFVPGLFVSVRRISSGPTTLDRLLGFDLLTITLVALMIVQSIHADTDVFMELILIVTALGFFTTVAFFYYLSHLPATNEKLNKGEEND